MRAFRILVALSCLVLGVALGALNPQVVAIDLGPVVLRATLGVALLATLLLGAIAGGLAIMVSVVLPMRHGRRQGAVPPAMDAN